MYTKMKNNTKFEGFLINFYRYTIISLFLFFRKALIFVCLIHMFKAFPSLRYEYKKNLFIIFELATRNLHINRKKIKNLRVVT